jgi:hypothetical protein
MDRPERSIRDLVGRLPVDEADFHVAAIESGPHAGKLALHYKIGKLSETAGWLATLIREEIAGDQSLNAVGSGHPDQNGDFIVEAFEDAISLDFVTTAAAGGKGILESDPGSALQEHTEESQPESWESLTVESLAEARPDIVNNIAQRERSKAYGEKKQLTDLQEANRIMSKQLEEAKKAAAKAIRDKRKLQAEQVVTEGLAGLPEKARPQVRRLVESQVRQFVEQMEIPEISLPVDVQALPEEAQADWMKAYYEGIATGAGEEEAAAAAWVAVYAKWEQDEAGSWRAKAAPAPETSPILPETPPMTVEALKASVAAIVDTFRQALAEAAGPGVSGVTRPNPVADTKAEDEARVQRYMQAGLSEAEAKIAVRGRVDD